MSRTIAFARRTTIAALGLLIGLAPHMKAQAASAPVDPRLYADLTWRNLGPFRAGRVGAVSGVIGQPGVFYAGFPGGGLWKSTNAGQTWVPVFDSVKEVSSVGAVEVAPSDPNVIYVGTGDMITGGTLDQGNGVYKSTDAGTTWRSLGLEGTKHIQTILVDPRSPDVVLVGALGDHVHSNDMRGVYRSTDGGRSWTKTLHVGDEIGITKLARAFDVPDVIFATSARHYAPPGYTVTRYRSWQFSLGPDTGRTGTAVYKSLDGGVTWKEIAGAGLPRLDGRLSIAVAMGTGARRVYLITNRALYRSEDGGDSWRQVAADDERIHNGQGGYSAGVYVDPKDPDLVYTLNTTAYRSTDGGRTFTGMLGAPGGDDPQQMWIDPTDGRRMLMGFDQGATVSLDGGDTWSSWYNQSTEQLYHLSTDTSYPYWVYATQQDAGAIRTRSRGNMGAITMFDWSPVSGWEWGTIIPDPLDPNTVYASGAGIVRISYPSEQWINVSPAVDPAANARATSTQPLVWAPWNPRLLMVGLNYVAGTTDGGAHWTRMSPDLGIPKGIDSATAARTLGGRGAMESLAASPVAPGVIWAGTSNGLIHVTRDTGRTWTDVSIPGLPAPLRANVTSIDPSHRAAGTAYAAVEYLSTGDHAPYVYRTRDFGRSWTKIVNGLPVDEPSGSFVRVVREDPKRPGLLFAGTESSIHISFDDGDHWQAFALNLPNTPVRDLMVKDNDLLIATHGRGLWVIDDISMLRQLTPALAAAPAHLFAPGRATRVRRNVNADTPLSPEIPHALNAPDGAIIDYWLGAAASDGVAIDILDAAGAVVRHYSSDPIAPVAEAAKPSFPNYWLAVPRALATSAGAHRVNWDLRHDAPPAVSHGFEISANPGLTPPSPEGPLALPGVYTVRLTANGVTRTQPVTVRNDPRSTVTPAALAGQHAFQLRITAAMRAAWDGQQQVTALRAALTAASGANAPADVVAAVATIRAAIDSVVGAETPGADAPRAPHPTFRSANEALSGQLIAQDNADWAPTPAMRAAFAGTCRELVTTHAAWQKVIAARLPAANSVFTWNGSAAVSLPRAEAPPPCQ